MSAEITQVMPGPSASLYIAAALLLVAGCLVGRWL